MLVRERTLCRWEDFKLSWSDAAHERRRADDGSGEEAQSRRRSVSKQDSLRTKTSVYVPLTQKAAALDEPSAPPPPPPPPAWLSSSSYAARTRRGLRPHATASALSGHAEYPPTLPSTIRAQRMRAGSEGPG